LRPPGRVTRTISLATSNGLGANIAPKMLTTRSKESSLTSFRLEASPSWNRQLVRLSACARRFPASTRLPAMSMPEHVGAEPREWQRGGAITAPKVEDPHPGGDPQV